MNRKDVCFIAAKYKRDYTFEAIKNAGFKIEIPYKDKNLFLRLLREFWFRLHLPFKSFFFNKKAICEKKIIVVYDPLITGAYLEWLKQKNPEAIIYLQYVNRADTTIFPPNVPPGIRLVSYDKCDCQKYNMQFISPSYFDTYSFDGPSFQKSIDVLFLGRDKGRLNDLLDIEKKLNSLGLITHFHICANRKFLRFKNRHYKRVLDYDDYLSLLKQSKSLLNVARRDQNAVTQRELECVFDGIKCITTNERIVDFKLYDESRFFVFNGSNYSELLDFMRKPFKPISKVDLDEFRFINVFDKTYLD